MIIENRSGVKCVTIFNIFHQNNSMRTLDIPVSNYYLKGSQTVVRKNTPGDEPLTYLFLTISSGIPKMWYARTLQV